ncbi:GLEYA domain-containing protein [Trichoderma sp. SZMC 28011]
MAVHKTLVQALVASAAMASVGNAHAIAVPAGQLDARTYPTPTCDPSQTVTQTETKTVTSWKALLTITLGGGTKTETKTEICTVTDTETVTQTETSTTTTTVTPTITPPSCPTQCPPPPSCNNLGFDWAYYNNSARNTDTTYSTFHPDSYKKTTPIYVGTTSYVGGLYQDTGTNGPIYDSSRNFNLDFFALNHHAYIYACEAGTYSVDIPYANDAVYLWIGANAYSGWTDDNAVAKARYDQPDHIAGKASYKFDIPANTYVPIRFFYGQAQYGGGFNFNITAPSGQVIVSNQATFSPYVVRYSCDGTMAPPFPAFGKET